MWMSAGVAGLVHTAPPTLGPGPGLGAPPMKTEVDRLERDETGGIEGIQGVPWLCMGLI